ncbi:hypothetical protein D3C71_949830 [compost metagenome]
MHLEPAVAQSPQHAHGLDGFGVVQVTGGQLAGLLGKNRRFAQGIFGHRLIEPGQPDQQHRTRRGKDPEPDVEQIDHEQVDRKPRRIEEGKQRRAGDKLTNVRQVAQCLPGVTLALEQITFESRLIDPQVEAPLQLTANTDDDKAANNFQQTDKGKEPDNHQRQHGQCRFILRRQDPIIDLKHVNRGH